MTLDSDEYFHLALHASSVGDHHACMQYLAAVLQQQPDNARAQYLLAVQHAELGLTARAVSGLKSALSIEPGLEMARFQLGLMLLLLDGRAEAKENLLKLALSRDESLRSFSAVLVAAADNDLALAQRKLAAQLARKDGNRPLAALMQRALEHLSAASNEPPQDVSQQEPIKILLGAYRDK